MFIFKYPVFICFIIFLIWAAYERKKATKQQIKTEKDFWEREAEANFTRRKNLDLLDYIVIPYDSFPIGKYEIPTIKEAEDILLSLKDKRILNLTGKTTTDLKLEYGSANLKALDEYDENYVLLVKTLFQYGEALFNAGYTDDAKDVLEFSIAVGSDIKGTYQLLAKIYSSSGFTEKINELIDSASKLDSLMKNSIIASLKEYL